MGHKRPVLRPGCTGAERAWTQLLFYPVPFIYRLFLFFKVLTVLLLFRLFLALFTGGLSCFQLLWTPINLLYASHDRLLRPKDELIFRDESKYFTLRDDEINNKKEKAVSFSALEASANGDAPCLIVTWSKLRREFSYQIVRPFFTIPLRNLAVHNLQQSHSLNKLHFARNVQCFGCLWERTVSCFSLNRFQHIKK
jgi:hypothetical protein